MSEIDEILKLIRGYVEKTNISKKWEPGKDWVQYSGPYYDYKEIEAAVNSLLSDWLVLGKDANKFEKKFPKILGKKLGILTNSGSSANLLMMSSLKSKRGYNLPNGTKVITPIAGFPTTINPILQVNFTPLFVDIEIDTLNLDLEKVEETCKKNPDAKIITFAHVLGNPPDMDSLMEIVKKYNLILLEDCCDALGSKFDGKLLGSFGKMSSCSFYPAHHITMGEGGFVAMDDLNDELIIRSFRDWGRGCYCVGKSNLLENGRCGCRFNYWLPALPEEIFDHKYIYEEIGFNLKPIELQASMGLVQIDKLNDIENIRKENYNSLYKIFNKYEEYFILHKAQKKSDPSWFAFPITVKNNKFKRSDICKFFESQKIQTRPYFAGNIMLQPAYDGLINKTDLLANYPIATRVTTDTFFLGTSPVINQEKINYIENTLDNFIKKI